MNETLIAGMLEIAVPLWAEKLMGMSWPEVTRMSKTCSDHIAEHGDMILYRGKKKGESAEAFNHLAAGVACLSFAPGGVTIFGVHFEHTHPESTGKA